VIQHWLVVSFGRQAGIELYWLGFILLVGVGFRLADKFFRPEEDE
jgi:putative Mn2+ efflux pump MntP